MKRLVSMLIAALMLLMLVPAMPSYAEKPDPVFEPATQSRYYNFSTSYTLTGNGASDMVAIAFAQLGKTGSDLGYTEQWCADFVGDCAILAGQSTVVPLYGACTGLRDRVLSAGGSYSTSDPQPGDLCFFDWNPYDSDTLYDHVEIVYAVTSSTISTIGGNTGSGSDLYSRRVATREKSRTWECIMCTVRPNYSGGSGVTPTTPPSGDVTDPTQYSIPTGYLNVGDSGNGVKWLQACLCQLGYTTDVDGQFGSGTAAKLKQFQTAYGLTVDGGMGPEVRSKMLELLTCSAPSISSYQNSNGALVTMSKNGGTFTSDASIFYTTNGSDPTTSSSIYGGQFYVTSSCTAKALAWKACRYASPIASAWIAVNTYTVTFKDWDGTVLKTQTVFYSGSATPPSNPSRTGYTFSGWSGTYTNVTSNQTVTATYMINTYTVTFKDWDGTVLKTQTVNYGSAATAPADPSRTGYTFTGWDKAFNNITANTVVTATYTINTYTVTFKDHDGTVLKTQTVNHGSSATPPADPTWEGHTFTGWSGTYINVTANQVVTATYDVNLYNISFYLGGELYQTQTVTYGAAIALPEVSVYGYTFSGWTLENGEPVPASMPAHDLNVYGTLIRNVFTVTYVGDYTGTEEVVYGENAVLPVLDAEGLHYTFTVNGEPWDGTNITSDVTVTVGMDIDVYTVTFVDGVTGEILSVQQIEYADPADAPEAPGHYGYTFEDWDADYSCVTGDMTVTAVYTPVTFTVIFTDGLDNIISVQEVPYLSAAEEPEIPVREGWVFTGWDADFSSVEASMVVNALWEKQCCVVTFTGSYNDEVCVPYGEDCPLPTYNSASICYVFKVNGEEWCPECVKADVTVTVSVAPVKTTYHTVTFVGMNGEIISVQSVQHGQAAEVPEAPAVPGYRFIGWDRDNFDCVTYSMTRTAVYERTDDILPGDVNGDGQFNFNDISTLSMYLLGTGTLGEGAEANADYNGDGKVDFKDISDMYMAILG